MQSRRDSILDLTPNGDTVAIVGAGLVGCLLAIYLARRGLSVEVFERHADLRSLDLSAQRSSINLSLCERGLAVLDEVELGDTIREHSVPAYGRLIHDVDGALAYQPYGNRGERTYSILRNVLNEILLATAEERWGVRFHFEHRCKGLDLDTNTLRFVGPGGETRTVRADRIFGADGVFSAVRQRLQKTPCFNYSQEFLEHGYKELKFNLSGQSEWMTRGEAVHLWPRGGFMLIGLPNVDGSFVCALHLPLKGDPSFRSLDTDAKLLAFLERWFPDVARHIPSVSEFFHTSINHFVSVRCFPWVWEGRIALIGDSAHAVFPFYAQGVNSGFEDCAVLDRSLGQHCPTDGGIDWPTALDTYQRARKPDVDAISELSRRHFLELRDLVGQEDFQLRKRVERRLNERFPKRFTPLYSLVTFTTTRYSEAVSQGRRLEALVERIVELSRSAQSTDEELDRLIDRVIDPLTDFPNDPRTSPELVSTTASWRNS